MEDCQQREASKGTLVHQIDEEWRQKEAIHLVLRWLTSQAPNLNSLYTHKHVGAISAVLPVLLL